MLPSVPEVGQEFVVRPAVAPAFEPPTLPDRTTNPAAMTRRIGLALLCGCLASPAFVERADAQPAGLAGDITLTEQRIEYRTGSDFAKALSEPLYASWTDTPVRRILERLSRQQRIAVRLDRRVDPSTPLTIDLPGVTTQQALERVASETGLGLTSLGATVVLGPPEKTRTLRTLAELREAEFKLRLLRADRTRRLSLTRRPVLRWNDLTSPVDILADAARQGRFALDADSAVPHDLWAGGGIAGCTWSETLTLILWEFDRHFAWSRTLDSATVTDLPEAITLARSYRPKSLTPEAATQAWKEKFPAATFRVSGRSVVVDATVEEHERIAALSSGAQPAENPMANPNPMPVPPGVTPLARRRFTLRIQQVPAIALLQKLNQSGMTVTWDEPALNRAGVNLRTPINIDVKNATADAFFAAVTEPLGLRFKIDGVTVTLSPK